MKAAFLTSSLIAPKGKALPASRATTPTKLLDDESNRQSGVSRIYERVSEHADPHEENESLVEVAAPSAGQNSSSQTDENETVEDAIVLHEDETVSIAADDDIYDFSKPEDEPQSVFDRIREHNTDVDTAEPVFEDTGSDLFEAPSNKTPTSPAKKKRVKSQPKAAKPVSNPILEEKPVAPSKSKTPAPNIDKKEVAPSPPKPAVEAKKLAATPPKKDTPSSVSAVPPRRANWARPASAPGWQKKVQTPDILSYWMEIRNGNRYPTWQNLDTQKIGKFWPNCVLVHCNHSSGRLQLETSFSNELRQSAKRANPLRDFTSDIDFSPMVVDWVLSLARDVANTGKPAHGTEHFPSVFDEIPIRVIALPLSENQVDVDHVLCYVQKLS